MRWLNWKVYLGISLIGLSAVLYTVHYLVFKDPHHIFIYMLGDVAFVPLEVLFVTIVIHQLLSTREKRAMLKKLNMVIGAFFSEVGTRLLETFARLDPHWEMVRRDLALKEKLSDDEFRRLSQRVKSYKCSIVPKPAELAELHERLIPKRAFLLALLENPNLLEHETFTDLLWGVFHLMEELDNRVQFTGLPDTDYQHLAGDIKRAYSLLIAEWLEYMKHLKDEYPYLFSLAIRTNPFDQDASPIVE